MGWAWLPLLLVFSQPLAAQGPCAGGSVSPEGPLGTDCSERPLSDYEILHHENRKAFFEWIAKLADDPRVGPTYALQGRLARERLGEMARRDAILAKDPRAGSRRLLIDQSTQDILCGKFMRDNFVALQEELRRRNLELQEVYDHIMCDLETQADLLRERTSISTGNADLMSVIRYYIKIRNDHAGLIAIMNRVIDNREAPRGTLLDFVHFYGANPNLSEIQKREFRAYEAAIRRFGGKTEAELAP